jgi:hypothetical protein
MHAPALPITVSGAQPVSAMTGPLATPPENEEEYATPSSA